MLVELSQEERQATMLALAELALSRPGWDDLLRGIAAKYCGVQLFEEFKQLNRDRVPPVPLTRKRD